MFRLLAILLSWGILSAAAWGQWTSMPSSPSGLIQDILDADGIIYAASAGNGIYKSIDSAGSWESFNNGLNSNNARAVYQMLRFESDMYIATIDGIYRSTDDGDSWIKKSDGIFVGNGALYAFTESIFEHNGDLFTGAWTGIYRSTDSGENWDATNVTGQGISPRYFSNHNGILFAARESINFPNGYKSTNNGVTWQPLTTISLPTITFLSEPPDLWAGTIGGVWLSSDNGVSWEQRSEGLALDPYNSSIIRVNGVLVSSVKFGGSGMFRSSNEGIHWDDFGEGLPFLNTIDKLIIYGDHIIAATSEGLWERDISEIPTGIETPGDPLPQSFKLSQNYPNPFNSSTRIEYSVPSGSEVVINVYDILGNEIVSLLHKEMPAGKYNVEFDASELPSGAYYYRIQACDLIETKKMTLLK